MVKRGYADFKRDHTGTNYAEHTGRPNLAVVPENTKKLHKPILANRKLKLHEIAEELKILEGSVFTILHEYLSMRKLFKVGAVFAHNQSKTTMHQRFRALFATVSMQQKGVFV